MMLDLGSSWRGRHIPGRTTAITLIGLSCSKINAISISTLGLK